MYIVRKHNSISGGLAWKRGYTNAFGGERRKTEDESPQGPLATKDERRKPASVFRLSLSSELGWYHPCTMLILPVTSALMLPLANRNAVCYTRIALLFAG